MLPSQPADSKHTNLLYSLGLSVAVYLLRLPLPLLWGNRHHFRRPTISAPCLCLSCSPCFPHFLICLDGFSPFRRQLRSPFLQKVFHQEVSAPGVNCIHCNSLLLIATTL